MNATYPARLAHTACLNAVFITLAFCALAGTSDPASAQAGVLKGRFWFDNTRAQSSRKDVWYALTSRGRCIPDVLIAADGTMSGQCGGLYDNDGVRTYTSHFTVKGTKDAQGNLNFTYDMLDEEKISALDLQGSWHIVYTGSGRFTSATEASGTADLAYTCQSGGKASWCGVNGGLKSESFSAAQIPWTFAGAATGRLPIVFLPGVGGSELYSGSERVWIWEEYLGLVRAAWHSLSPISQGPSDWDTPRFKMALNLQGKDTEPKGNIEARDILRSGVSSINFYGDLIALLESKSYKQNTDLFLLPYDWRLDNRSHFARLGQAIDKASVANGGRKVILMAHSMGGLIARAFLIANPKIAEKVDSLITIATPYWGSPKAYYAVVNGYTFGNPTVSQKVMKFLGQNMPAAFQLMPRRPFIVDTQTRQDLSLEDARGIRYRDLTWAQFTPTSLNGEWAETRDCTRGLNPEMLKLVDEFWKPLGTPAAPTALPSSVTHYVIIGQGVQTLDRYLMRPRELQVGFWASWEKAVVVKGKEVVLVPAFDDGDGTVPRWSAEISTARNTTYYVPYESKFAFGTGLRDVSSEHSAMPKNPKTLAIIQQILEGKPPKPSDYPPQPAADPARRESLDLSLHSNAHLDVVDAETGEALGMNSVGGVAETLGNGTFVAMDSGEYASVGNLARQYHVLVTGAADGEFSLVVDITKQGQIASFVYPNVPVKAGSIAQLDVTPSQTANALPPIQVTTGGQSTSVPAQLTGITAVQASPDSSDQSSGATVAPGATVPSPEASPPTTTVATATLVAPLPGVLSAPPGLYVSGLRLEPSPPTRRQRVEFHVTFLNTLSANQNYRWLVYIYKADNLRKSFGETSAQLTEIPVGTVEQKSLGSWGSGIGDCEDHVARVGWLDENKQPTFFAGPNGQVFEQPFTVCP